VATLSMFRTSGVATFVFDETERRAIPGFHWISVGCAHPGISLCIGLLAPYGAVICGLIWLSMP